MAFITYLASAVLAYWLFTFLAKGFNWVVPFPLRILFALVFASFGIICVAIVIALVAISGILSMIYSATEDDDYDCD